jgi:transposase
MLLCDRELFQELEEVPMGIVGALDVHRRQLTFDYVDTDTGEISRGRIAPADRVHLRDWLGRFDGRAVEFAFEGCTGWRYVAEELARAGAGAHLAEPADTAALRGPKRRAKTDRADARHLRELLQRDGIPESWIPPAHVLEARATVRLYKDLADQRVAWTQRLHATLFHLGVPAIAAPLASDTGRHALAAADLTPATRQAVEVAVTQIDAANCALAPLKLQIARLSRRQPGCRALQARHYGIGPLTSVAIWAEMGDTRRFSSSSDAVRHAGLDITVWASDTQRAKGHLSRQGASMLRWALYEAAMAATKSASPDHDYWCALRQRLGAQRAALTIARKLARRCHHTLRAVGDDAWIETA